MRKTRLRLPKFASVCVCVRARVCLSICGVYVFAALPQKGSILCGGCEFVWIEGSLSWRARMPGGGGCECGWAWSSLGSMSHNLRFGDRWLPKQMIGTCSFSDSFLQRFELCRPRIPSTNSNKDYFSGLSHCATYEQNSICLHMDIANATFHPPQIYVGI